MVVNKLKLSLLLTCFLYTIFNFSQNLTKETTLLSKILFTAEKQYNVRFTYANKIIENITLGPYAESLNLNETIEYLKKNTQLTFTFLTSTDILISKERQTDLICGYLIDSNTGKYIEGAHISVQGTNSNTISTNTGYFEIDQTNENQVIKINHIAYPTIYLNSTEFQINKPCLTISLSEKTEQLDEIILKNYLTSGITVKTNNTITIDTKDFGILPGLIEPDVLQQIQALPGISSVNETISNINIRGGTNDQNLLLWDGIKMYHSGHFFGLISAFNPYLTDHITLTKNGTNPQYNDGVSGTIQIQSIDEIHKKPFGGAGFNLLSTDAYAHIPISKNAAIQFSGRRAITDLLNTPTFEQYFKRAFQDSKISELSTTKNVETNSEFNFFDYNLKFLYDFDKKNRIRLSFLNVHNKLHFNESLLTETITKSKTSKLKQKNVAVGLQITTQWNPQFKTLLHSYYTKYNIDAENYTLLNEQRLLQKNEVLETGIILNTYLNINKNIQLLNGYHFSELGITNIEDVNLPLFMRTIKNVIRNHAVYSDINYSTNDNKTFINGGLRLNYIEKFSKLITEPRLQILHKLNSNFSFKILGEFKSQNATQIIDLQEDFLGVEKRRWVLADNENIPIVRSKQASIGFNYKKNNFFLDVEGFYKTVDGITTSNQGFQNQNQYIINKSGSYSVYGIEFLANKKTETFSTWVGYTLNKNTYIFPELTPDTFPNNLDIRHTVSFGNTFTYNNFNLALGVLWRTGKPYTTPTESNPVNISNISKTINYTKPNSSRLPNYIRADFSATYKFKLSPTINAQTGVSVLNVLNTKNTLNTYYKIDREDNASPVDNHSIGFSPNANFRIAF